jgi:hypothetical protein
MLEFNKRHHLLAITDTAKIESGEQSTTDNLDPNIKLGKVKFNINGEIEISFETKDMALCSFVYSIENNYRTVVLNIPIKVPFEIYGIEHVLNVALKGSVNLELTDTDVSVLGLYVTTRDDPSTILTNFDVTPIGYELDYKRVPSKPPLELGSTITLENVDVSSHVEARHLGRDFVIPTVSSNSAVQLSFLETVRNTLNFQIEQTKKQLL